MLVVVATLALAGSMSNQANILRNPDFQNLVEGWYIQGTFTRSAGDPGGPPWVVKLVVPPGKGPWEHRVEQRLEQPLAGGKAYRLSFMGRSSTESRVSAYLQEADSPFTDYFRQEIRLGKAWKRYEVGGIVPPALAGGKSKAGVFVDLDPGEVELGSFRLEQVAESSASEANPVVLVPKSVLAENRSDEFSVTNTTYTPIPGGIRTVFNPKDTDQPWSAVLHIPTQQRISSNDTITVSFQARSLAKKRISVHLEQAQPPFSKFLSASVRLTPEFREYRFAASSPIAYAPGESQVAFYLAHESGDAEFKDLEVRNVGLADPRKYRSPVDIFGGAPNPDTWRAAAEARIEKIRKGTLRVEVVNANGKPVPGATVRIEQVRHAFRFGTCAPAFRIAGTDEDSAKFREHLKRYFNTVTFENDLKWPTMDPRDYTDVEKAFEFLRANQFDVRGHVMVWGSPENLPRPLWLMTDAEIRAAIADRIKDLTNRFRGRIYLWDVVNEAVDARQLWDRLGWDEFARTFRLARQADPKIQLCYNDYNWTEEAAVGPGHRRRALELVRNALAQGAPIDVIGIQCHLQVPLTPVKRVLEIVDEIAALGKSIEVTEFDIGGVDDPEQQARYTADYLTAMFSHPSVQSFILWGFWEGSHWRAHEGAAMILRDWTPTPSMKAWEDLVKRKWWTRANLAANSRGAVQTRAFYGTHKVTVSANGKTTTQKVEIPKGRNLTVRVVLR
jgi:GH35 family endo-1,4-beta-xylanase